jgi:hypothetical protein
MALLGALVLGASPVPVLAQAPGGTDTSLPPSWYGVWGGGSSPDFPAVENPRAVLEGRQNGEPNLENSYIFQNLRPWAQQRYLSTEWGLDDLGARCQLMGIFRQGIGNNSAFRFMESTPGKFYRTSGTYEETGLHPIRFAKEHPADLRPTYTGHSIAYWDGETLVIDTKGFNDKTWISTDRGPHTEALHVIERYRLVGDGSYLELRAFLDDHRAFERPMTFTRYYQKRPEPMVSTEGICNPQEEGANLWWERYRMALEDHQSILEDFMEQTLAERPAPPAYSGPARIGTAGGGRGGGGRGGGGRGGGAAPAGPEITVRPLTADETAKLRALTGAWRIGAFDEPLPDGLSHSGSLLDLPLSAAGLAAQGQHDVANDPGRFCQAIGPFRQLARPGNALEILPTGQGAVMVFESTATGNKRDIIFGRDHLANFEPNWLGDSVGRFEGDTLVVSTRSFNDRTWLNDAAAQHSPELHMIERYRKVTGGDVLELTVTIEDAVMLTQPYTYTRYYQRGAELQEQQCFADIIPR